MTVYDSLTEEGRLVIALCDERDALRARAEKAEARVAELEAAIKDACLPIARGWPIGIGSPAAIRLVEVLGSSPSASALDLAKRAVESREARKNENIEVWAEKLAADSVAAGEAEYGPGYNPRPSEAGIGTAHSPERALRAIQAMTRDFRCADCGRMMTNHVYVTRCECGESYTGPEIGYLMGDDEPNDKHVLRSTEAWGTDIVAAREALGLPVPRDQGFEIGAASPCGHDPRPETATLSHVPGFPIGTRVRCKEDGVLGTVVQARPHRYIRVHWDDDPEPDASHPMTAEEIEMAMVTGGVE